MRATVRSTSPRACLVRPPVVIGRFAVRSCTAAVYFCDLDRVIETDPSRIVAAEPIFTTVLSPIVSSSSLGVTVDSAKRPSTAHGPRTAVHLMQTAGPLVKAAVTKTSKASPIAHDAVRSRTEPSPARAAGVVDGSAARRGLDAAWLFAGDVVQIDAPTSRMSGSASLGSEVRLSGPRTRIHASHGRFRGL